MILVGGIEFLVLVLIFRLLIRLGGFIGFVGYFC